MTMDKMKEMWKNLEAKKKNIIIGIAAGVVAAIVIVIACVGIFRGFNAQGYVNVVLSQNLKGEVKGAVKMTKGLTEAQAKEQYELTVESFVKNIVASGLELNDEQTKQCVDISKKIFKDMKYEVQEAKKISDEEYEVPVKYQTTDVITKLQALATDEKARVEAKVQKGEFRGSGEELEAQMQAEFAGNLPTMLQSAYDSMEFGEETTVVLKVTKNEKGLYVLDGTQTSQFIAKIMGLSVNQD